MQKCNQVYLLILCKSFSVRLKTKYCQVKCIIFICFGIKCRFCCLPNVSFRIYVKLSLNNDSDHKVVNILQSRLMCSWNI